MTFAKPRWKAHSTGETWRTVATTSLRRMNPCWWPLPTSWRESVLSSCCLCVLWCVSGDSPAASTHTGIWLTTYLSWSDEGKERARWHLLRWMFLLNIGCCWCCLRGVFKSTIYLKSRKSKHTGNSAAKRRESPWGYLEPLLTWRTTKNIRYLFRLPMQIADARRKCVA